MEDILIATADRSILVFIPDSAQTDGSGKTGLVAANITVSHTRVETDNDVVVTDVTGSLSDLSALTDAHADWGWKEVSSALAPGLYRLDVADAVFASGAWYAVVYVMVTTSAAAPSPKAFRLVAFNALDGVRLGLTALPAAAADAAGGLPISDAGGLDLDAQIGTKINDIRGYLDTEIAAILAAVDTEIAAIVTATTAAAIRTALGLASANLDTQIGDLPTNVELATALGTADDAVLTAIALNLTKIRKYFQLALRADSAIATDNATELTEINADGGSGPGGYVSTTDALEDIRNKVATTITQTAAAAIRTALGLASANLDTQLAAIAGYLDTEMAAVLAAVDTEVAAILVDTGTDIPATLAGLFTTAMTESYNADGAAATPAQALYVIMQALMEMTYVGTTGTAKKLDGTTTAFTVTINNAVTPTGVTRAT